MQIDQNNPLFPIRKKLPHAVPAFVRDGSLFFITICGEPRGTNQFAQEPQWTAIVAAAQNYQDRLRWHCRLLLAMPDHIHALISFPRDEDMKKVVAAWKHFLAGNACVVWSRDFFDHRLMSHESLDEKAAYIRENPVRAGLAAHAEDWAFVWSPPDIVATPVD